MKIRFSLLLYLFTSISLLAQIEIPSLSPKIITKQKVGLANFTLEYGQPSKNGREIFGSLIPYYKLWRTGANASTKITFDKEVSFLDNKIPAGTYGLYSIPNKKEWTIVIHKKSNLWGAGGYQKENDFVRFTVPVQKTNDITQTLNIRFENFTINGADLIISWGKTKVTIPILVDSDAIIENQIKNKITSTDKTINPQTYFDAAQFYYQKNKNLNKAFEWFTKATELRPKAFWYTYYKAELAHKLGKNKIAKQDAAKCLKAAEKSKLSDYGYIAKCSILLNKIINRK